MSAHLRRMPAPAADAGTAIPCRGVRKLCATATLALAIARPFAAFAADPAVHIAPIHGASIESAALLLSGQQGGPLSVAVAAFGLEDPPRIGVELEVQGAAWKDAVEPRMLVAVYAVAADGGVAANRAESVALAGAARDAFLRGGLRHLTILPVAAGEYDVRILVRDSARPEVVALRRVRVTIGGNPTPTPPRLADAEEGWVAATPERVAELPGGRWLPVRTVLPLGGPVRTDLDRATTANEASQVELRSSDDQVTALPLAHEGTSGSGSFVLRGVATGEYELRVRTGEALSPAVSIVVVDSDPEGRPWVAFGNRAVMETTHLPPARARRLRKGEIEDLRTGAVAIRREAAAHDSHAAARTVASTVAPLLFGPEPLAPAIAAQLLGEQLRPQPTDATLIALLDAALVLIETQPRGSARSPVMQSFGALLVRELAESARGRAVATRNLAAHAALVTLPAAGDRSALLRTAVELAENDPEVIAALAAEQAARAGPAAAEPPLERWLALAPASTEAQLRLGIVELRLGHTARGRALLRQVAADRVGEDAWLARLAVEELARDALDRGDSVAAERLAREGVARLGDDEKLLLLQAAAAQALGRRADAAAALARVRPRTGASGEGDRFRFGRLESSRASALRAGIAAAARSAPPPAEGRP